VGVNPKKKIYTSLTVFGAVYLLLILFIIFPLFQGIKQNSEELVSGRKGLISFVNEIENLETSEKFYKSNQANLEKIEELLINREVPIEFITFLERNAANSQLESKVSLLASGGKDTDSWPSLSFQLSLTGSFPDFLKFLERLENGPYLTEILNLNIQKAAKGSSQASFAPSSEVKGSPSSEINAILSIKVFAKK